MTADHEDQATIDTHHQHIRWLKRVLRWMPRKTNIHRYPGLGWLANAAKKRPYLWSLKYPAIAPAFYAGSILSFLPIMGIQIPVAFLFALILRANLPVMIALQFITNWVTAVPIYYTCYEIGRLILHLLGFSVENIDMQALREFFGNVTDKNWAMNGKILLRVFGVMSIGGVILGSFFALVLDASYRLVLRRMRNIWERVKEIRKRSHEKALALTKEHEKPETTKEKK
jgi:uncharacterized protein